jgi:hypothetical protein
VDRRLEDYSNSKASEDPRRDTNLDFSSSSHPELPDLARKGLGKALFSHWKERGLNAGQERVLMVVVRLHGLVCS